METRQFNVTGMSCAACSSRVEKAVCALRGVSAAEVNLLTNSLKATFDEGVLGVEDIEGEREGLCGAREDCGRDGARGGRGGGGRSRARAPHLVLCAARTPHVAFDGADGGPARARHAHGGAGRSDDGLHAVPAHAAHRASQPPLLHGRPQGARQPRAQHGQPHRGWIGHSAALWRLRDLQASCGPGCG